MITTSTEWQPQVVKLTRITKHPEADTLQISTVLGGYVVIFKEGRFQEGDLAAYIPVDTIVSDNSEFDWLESKKRIRAKRLRGIFSMGILATPPPDMVEGDSVVEFYGLNKYDSEEDQEDKRGNFEYGLDFVIPKYDLDPLRRYKWLLEDGEEVVITEKIEGCNAGFLHDGERLWVKSRGGFKKFEPANLWWEAALRYKLAEKLLNHTNLVFFAELYGQVGGFPYDCEVVNNKRQTKLRFFDVFNPKTQTFSDWFEVERLAGELELETAPVLYKGPWKSELWELSDGKSSIGDHIREGCVVKPEKERVHHHQGRVALKLHGEQYLIKKK